MYQYCDVYIYSDMHNLLVECNLILNKEIDKSFRQCVDQDKENDSMISQQK